MGFELNHTIIRDAVIGNKSMPTGQSDLRIK